MTVESDIIKVVLASMKDATFSLIEADSTTTPASLRLSPGQEVRGEVLTNLPNGRFLVRIAGELLNMNLPGGARPGETLQMTFVTNQPRPTFALTQSGNQAVPAKLSEAGRWLGLLARSIAGESRLPSSPLPGSPPLLEAGPTDTPALAERLREAVTRSGVFYESHLAEWVNGKGGLDGLLREPQGRLSFKYASAHGTAPEKPGEPSPHASSQNIGNTGADKPSASPPSPLAADFADTQTVPIIKQQLAILNTGRFIWEGEVWPQQQMEWSVEEREANPDEAEGKSWQTTLRLDLPRLGSVCATLHMKNHELSVMLETDKENAATFMRQTEHKLVKGLSGTGVTLAGMVIKHEKPERKDQESCGTGL
ncbi:MAG: hypothetical protein FD174_4200 [Geobacteraceae bacterium]|nr:MAG: hypothetical protein FD174_4200 [Geobacteraceae bacterium]